jgi:ATP-binding cassette subfamily B protein
MKNKFFVFGIFFTTIKKFFWIFVIILVLLAITKGVSLMTPFYFREITNVIASGLPYTQAVHAFLGLAFVYIIHILLWRMLDFLLIPFYGRCMGDLHKKSFQTISKQSFEFFTNVFSGSLVKKENRFVNAFDRIMDIFFFSFFRQSLHILFVAFVFFRERPIFGWVFLGTMIIFIVSNAVFSFWKMKYDEYSSQCESKISGHLSDVFSNFLTVKSFAKESDEISTLDLLLQKWEKSRWWSWGLGSLWYTVQAFLLTALELFLIYQGIMGYKAGTFTAGDFIFFQTYLTMTFSVMWDFGGNLRHFFWSYSEAQEMGEIFHNEGEKRDAEKTLEIPKGEIVFDAVSFSYPTRNIFQNLSLEILPKQKVAFVGHTGAGKSTLVKLLFRFYECNAGKIVFDGMDISQVSLESLRNSVSLVPQDPGLFHRTIRENIAYGNSEVSFEDIQNAAKKAHIHDLIESLPQGYETLVGEKGVKLSGGERQRVAIARAILADRPILIFDEATSSLDTETETQISQALTNVMAGKTVIIIAHRLSTVQFVDKIFVFQEGEIVEAGTHDELLERGGVYRTFWKQ